MLNIYLCPKRRARYVPSLEQQTRWLNEARVGGLIHTSDVTSLQALSGPESVFTPGLGVQHLFNQDAREELLPVELTFESLHLCRAPLPALLPPEAEEQTQRCPQCEDELSAEDLALEMKRLELISFEQSVIFCQSCQADIPTARLVFDPPAAFSCFWIELREVGSSRLNPALVRAWEVSLGAPLELLIDQRVSDYDEIISTRRESEVWRALGEPEIDLGFVIDSDSRAQYRASRYQRRQPSPKTKTRQGGSGRRRASEVTRLQKERGEQSKRREGGRRRWDDQD